jgi:tetratricopeptide (TPR) repeat protein
LLVAVWLAAVGTAAVSTAVTATAEPAAPTVDQLVAEGTALHDAGKFDEAIARYRQALALDPDNAVAAYEIAFSYGAKKDYARCVEAARVALQHPGDQEARIYSVAGSCLDDAGKGDEAAAMYRQGLAKHPRDPHLGYNLAVTLWRAKKNDEAVAQLYETIGADPAAASPYMLLATIDHQQGRDLPSLFALLRYLMVDHESERSHQAATMALGAFHQGVKSKPAGKDGKAQIDISLAGGTLDAHDIFSSLEVARGLAAAASYREGEAHKSEATRQAEALESFLAMADEMANGWEAAPTPTGEWKLVVAPVLALHGADLGLAFGYLVAERAGAAGAAEWQAAHGEAVRALEAALVPARPR